MLTWGEGVLVYLTLPGKLSAPGSLVTASSPPPAWIISAGCYCVFQVLSWLATKYSPQKSIKYRDGGDSMPLHNLGSQQGQTLATTRWSTHRQATLSLLICPSMQMPSSYSWNTQRSLKTLIKIGGFHIALNYLSLCERKYANSGLEDLLIESGVYAAGTTSVLTLRKSYNRGIHAPKLVMEALRLRLLWKPSLEWLSKKAGALDNKVKQDIVHRSSECRTTIKMKGFVNDPWLKLQGCVERLFSLLDAFKSESKEKSKVFGFWVEYIVMVLML